MSALFILIGVSLLVAIGFLIAFIWSAKNGQYDDDYTPSVRILFDNPSSLPLGDDLKKTEQQTTNNKISNS